MTRAYNHARAGTTSTRADPMREVEALCRADPEAWFPVPCDTTGPKPQPTPAARAAIAICHRCPLFEPCRKWIMATERPANRYGVVAGMTPHMRQSLARREKRGR